MGKGKIGYLVVLIVLAAIGIVTFQISWLKNSYQISREKIIVDASKTLDESIAVHKGLVADTVRRLLTKMIKETEIETKVISYHPDSQNVTLAFRTSQYPGAFISFEVPQNDLSRVQKNAYQFILEKTESSDFERLHSIYVAFVGIANYKSNSQEELLRDSLISCFNIHNDTTTLHGILNKRLALGQITKIVYLEGLNGGYEEQFHYYKPLSSTNHIEISNSKKRTTLTSKMDSLEATIRNLNRQGDLIYVAKPILDDVNTIIQDEVSVIIIEVKISMLDMLQKMIISVIGSILLLILIGFCLISMFYTIVKQKKLANMKDDFISNVSHELKTPVATTLAAIQGMQYFDVLKDKKKTDQYLNTAANEMQRLSKMIDTILNSAIYESSSFKINPVRFNLKEMLSTLIEVQKLQTRKEVNIHLLYQIENEIYADQTHLHHVFTNLIDNAIKYGKTNVIIDITCTQTDFGLRIQVRDNGFGIPYPYQKNIFDKFFRVPTPHDHSIKGHGLGLNYVKNIIEKHNGTISLIKSDSTGSVFEINLPQ